MTGSDRVPYLTSRESIPEHHRHHYDSIAESRGAVRGPFSVLMNSPELAGRIGHLGSYVRFEGELSDDVRELAILTTARVFDCAYEWAAHEPIAREAGVRPEAIETVASTGDTDELDDGEAAVVEFARELLETHEIADETFEAAHDRFGDTGVVELAVTVGYYAMIACSLNAFEVFPGEDEPQLP